MNKKVRVFAVSELVDEWFRPKVNSIDDLVYLGQDVITRLIRKLREKEGDLRQAIQDLYDNKSIIVALMYAGKIQEFAPKYLDPEITTDDVFVPEYDYENHSLMLEPCSPKLLLLKKDSTTFNMCGRCRYASCGSGKYDFTIDPGCSLLPYEYSSSERFKKIPQRLLRDLSIEDDENVPGLLKYLDSVYPGIWALYHNMSDKWETDRMFYSPCIFKHYLSQNPSEVEIILAVLQKEIDQYKKEKEPIVDKIKFLLSLKEKAEEKILLPRNRYNFTPGEKVLCYIGHFKETCDGLDFIQPATVHTADGERTLLLFDNKIFKNGKKLMFNGRGCWFSSRSWEVFRTEEFEYLHTHIPFAQQWVFSTLEDYSSETEEIVSINFLLKLTLRFTQNELKIINTENIQRAIEAKKQNAENLAILIEDERIAEQNRKKSLEEDEKFLEQNR